MPFSEFSDISFKSFHDSIKQKLGIPHVNYRASDGKPMYDKQWTINYTKPILNDLDKTKILAHIEQKEIDSEKLVTITKQEAKQKGFFKDEELL